MTRNESEVRALNTRVNRSAFLSVTWLGGLSVAARGVSHQCQQLVKDVPKLPLGLYKHLKRAEEYDTDRYGEAWQHAAVDQIAFIDPTRKPKYETQYFQQRVSHDEGTPAPSGNETFPQRYWYDATFYKPGGPVFLLDAGETNAVGRLPFLDHGILRILSEATGGIGLSAYLACLRCSFEHGVADHRRVRYQNRA
jgi:hypothetical protein